jgi:hypothetical protein
VSLSYELLVHPAAALEHRRGTRNHCLPWTGKKTLPEKCPAIADSDLTHQVLVLPVDNLELTRLLLGFGIAEVKLTHLVAAAQQFRQCAIAQRLGQSG